MPKCKKVSSITESSAIELFSCDQCNFTTKYRRSYYIHTSLHALFSVSWRKIMILSVILSNVVQLLNFVLLMSFICPDN